MFDITGRRVKLWVNDHEGRNGKFQTYTVSISKKGADGKYINKAVKLFIGKEAWKPDTVPNGHIIDFEGFPTLDIYTDKDGNEKREVAIYATKINWGELSADSFEELDEQIPF